MSTITLISPFNDFQTLPSNLSGQCQFSQYEYLATAGLIFIIPFATCTAFSNIMKSSISRQMGLPGPFITAATQHILTGIWTINQWQSIFTTSYQMSQWAPSPKKKTHWSVKCSPVNKQMLVRCDTSYIAFKQSVFLSKWQCRIYTGFIRWTETIMATYLVAKHGWASVQALLVIYLTNMNIWFWTFSRPTQHVVSKTKCTVIHGTCQHHTVL